MAIDLRALLVKGVEAQHAGRFEEAVETYRRVLKVDPNNSDALNLLGVLASAAGRSEEALDLHERAIAGNPHFADAHYNKGVALRALKRMDAAIAAFAQAVALNDRFAEAYLNLGTALADAGELARAVDTFTSMAEAFPQDARAFYNLGHCLARVERRAEAKAAFATAARLQPDNTEFQIALADLDEACGDPADAIAILERVLQREPNSIDVHDRLPGLLVKAGRPQEAVAAYDVAIRVAHAAGDVQRRSARMAGLGDAYRALGDWGQAISSYEHALLGVAPSPEVLSNIAELMAEREWMAAAGVLAEDASRLRPDDHRYMHNRAMFELKRGHLASGWEKYEARIKANNAPDTRAEPRWAGQDLSGRRILIWPEQGLGDQILYCGLLPDLVLRAREVVVEVEPRLVGVLTRSFPRARIFAGTGDGSTAIPGSIDFQIPMGSLPRILRREFRQFPRRGAYLKPDAERAVALRRRYEEKAAGRRIVGLSWRSRNAQFGAAKSLDLKDLTEVLRTPGVMFVNLQYGDCAEEIAWAKQELGVDIFVDTDINAVDDVDEFFAQVAAMDLVVSTSNTTVHVGGALDVPTWLMLPRGGGSLWYWFMDRNDSPWYPSVRLFRQPEGNDAPPWPQEVAKAVGDELQRWLTRPLAATAFSGAGIARG